MAVRSRRENHLLHVGARQQRMRLTQECQVPECTEFTLATIFLSLRNSTPFKSAHQNPIHQGERTGKSSDKLQQVNICIWQPCTTSEMVFGKSDKGGKTAMRSLRRRLFFAPLFCCPQLSSCPYYHCQNDATRVIVLFRGNRKCIQRPCRDQILPQRTRKCENRSDQENFAVNA